MKSRVTIPVLLICGGLALSGCETIQDNELSILNSAATAEGVRTLVKGEGLEEEGNNFKALDLDQLLDPEGKRSTSTPPTDAFEAFAKYGNATDLPIRRNLIQDRIIAASNQRCNLYKRLIKRVDSQVNLALGSLATILGGAGAIVTGVDSARALAGISGILSGVRAEFNQTYFASVATHVITEGIDNVRKEIRAEIRTKRFQFKATEPNEITGLTSLDKYSVAEAVADAVEYHGACSLIAGLQQASESMAEIKKIKEGGIGLKDLNTILESLKAANIKVDEIAKNE